MENGWLVGNLDRLGFYRVNYDQRNWNKLIKQLMSSPHKIERKSRAQLLDDAFNLGRAEVIEQTLFMNMSIYLKNENDTMPFAPAFAGFGYIMPMLYGDFDTFRLFKVFSFFFVFSFKVSMLFIENLIFFIYSFPFPFSFFFNLFNRCRNLRNTICQYLKTLTKDMAGILNCKI
jgi:hypothetical protein